MIGFIIYSSWGHVKCLHFRISFLLQWKIYRLLEKKTNIDLFFVFKLTVVENVAKHCSQTVLPLIEKIGNKSAIH